MITEDEVIKEQLDHLKRLEKLEDFEEQLIDANCNMLDRIIVFCQKNSVPFDNTLLVLLHEARKTLSPEMKRSPFSPDSVRKPRTATTY